MKFLDLNLISYQQALAEQFQHLEEVSKGAEDVVLFCSHPPVVTLGRSTQDGDVTTWVGDVVEIQRGGRATYHGPSQLVVYPILNLNHYGRDLHKYLRTLEQIIIEVLAEYKIAGGRVEDATGVWVNNRKIASIGIGVKKWVSYHGLALNVDHDPQAHQGINPCGYTTQTMTSMEEVLGQKVLRESLIQKFQVQFEKLDLQEPVGSPTYEPRL